MAIDTKEKRLSVLALDAAGTGIHTLPDPTGAFDGGDRQHVLDCYSGIAFGAPGGATLLAMERAAFRRAFGRVFGRVN
jgi:hypothetical protein